MLSRVADNLYWMSRYLERAEHTASLIDEHLNLMLDSLSLSEDQRWTGVVASVWASARSLHRRAPSRMRWCSMWTHVRPL